MISFAEFPEELRLRDHDIEHMSLKDLSRVFYKAEILLFGEERTRWQCAFWNAVTRVRHHSTRSSLQNVVDRLEEHKRQLGRAYARQHSILTLLKYNETERDIRWLAGEYELKRSSKPYFLGPKY